jgi:quinol monooxygenase YgiN
MAQVWFKRTHEGVMSMFVERAEIPVKAGEEAAFAEAMRTKGTAFLAGAAGCSSVQVGRGVEDPGKFILLLEWDAVESHIEFTKTEGFAEFRNLVGPYFAGAPAMEHFELL